MLMPGIPEDQPPAGVPGPGDGDPPPDVTPEEPGEGKPEGQDKGQGGEPDLTKEQQAVLTRMRQKDRKELEDLQKRDEERELRVQKLEWEQEQRSRVPAPEAEPLAYPDGVNSEVFESVLGTGLSKSPVLKKLEERVERAEEIARSAASTAAMGHFRVDAGDEGRYRHLEKVQPQLQATLRDNPNLNAQGLDAVYDSLSAKHERDDNARLREELTGHRAQRKADLEKAGATPAGTTPPARQGPDFSEMSEDDYRSYIAAQSAAQIASGEGIPAE